MFSLRRRALTALSLLAGLAASVSGCGSPDEAGAPAVEATDETAEAAPELPAAEAEPAEEVTEEVAEAPVTPTAHDVLLLVLHEEPLLPSESRVLGVLEERMRRRRYDVEMRDVTPEEATLARLFLDPSASEEARAAATLPATFGAATRIVVLRVPAPRTLRDGNRATRGFAGALLFRPPFVEPAFEAQIDDDSSWRLTDDRWSSWLEGLLREGEGA